MRYIFILLALAGVIVSSLALREHYRQDASPCSINEKWDCGVVNKSDYAMLFDKIPVAGIGIAGYLLLGILGGLRWFRLHLMFTVPALAFSLYLTYVEAKILETYCIYCVTSLGIISTTFLLSLITVIVNARRLRRAEVAQ